MTATASFPEPNEQPSKGKIAPGKLAKASSRRTLPAFPKEELYFEAKFIDNSQVVRAANPGSVRTCWSAVLSVVSVTVVCAGLMLPSAFRVITGQKIQAERGKGSALRTEIAELQARIAQHSGRKHLEEFAAAQKMVDPHPTQVQHITPKGSYARVSLPSGK
ncbi:MAG: hypothetical protein NW208_04205 [Bryobacter sp.]|nr:hypothetical protein [Bryobacter sp.]